MSVPDSISLQFIVNMAYSVKLFQFFQKFQQIIGLYPPQPNQREILIIAKRALFLIWFPQPILSLVAYFVYEAESMFEFGFAIYTLLTLLNSVAIYLLFIWQLKNTLEFIANCEGFIAKSKWLTNKILFL